MQSTVKKILLFSYKVLKFIFKAAVLIVCFAIMAAPDNKDESSLCDVAGGQRIPGSNDYIPRTPRQ